jgi:hypothetical protein
MGLWTNSRFFTQIGDNHASRRVSRNLGVQFLALLTRNNAHAAALVTAWGGASKGSNMCAAR